MYQNVAPRNIGLNKMIKGVEESSNILIFAIQQRIHDMQYLRVILNVVHIFCGSDNLMIFELPVLMLRALRKSRSRAAWISPIKIWFLVGGWVKTASELWYWFSSMKLSNIIYFLTLTIINFEPDLMPLLSLKISDQNSLLFPNNR